MKILSITTIWTRGIDGYYDSLTPSRSRIRIPPCPYFFSFFLIVWKNSNIPRMLGIGGEKTENVHREYSHGLKSSHLVVVVM